MSSKRDEIERVPTSHGAESVRVLGSLARGEGRPDSDINLLRALGQGRSLLGPGKMKQELQSLRGPEVDVVTEAAISPYLRNQVLKEAAVRYDYSPGGSLVENTEDILSIVVCT